MLGNVDDIIKSDVSTVLNIFLLLSVFWLLLKGFDDQDRHRKYHLNLGLSVLNDRFHCSPQTLPITSCLCNVITNLFWRQTQGAKLGGQDRRGTDFPTGAPQVYNFVSLVSNLGDMVRQLVSDKPGLQRTEENCTSASFQLKSELKPFKLLLVL